jgi:uncharacterized membrane protein
LNTSLPGARQPRLGLAGLLLVLPIAALLAVGAGGAEQSARVLGPPVTCALPLIAMVAFWWENWPGTRLRPSWSGWADTALIAVGAVVLKVVCDSLFAEPLVFAAAAFIAMLELTLVGEGWPLQRLPRRTAGLLALGISWAAAAVVYFVFADVRADLGPVLIVIGAFQALFYVAWRGWPFASIVARRRRLGSAHAAVITGGIGTYLLLHDVVGIGREPLAAAAACFVAAALMVGMQFEDWLDRGLTLVAAAGLALVLALVLQALAATTTFTRVSADDWVTHVGLNALGVSIILHVAIGRRWPFAPRPAA